MTPSRRRFLGLTLAGAAAACASPDPAYFTLAAAPGVARRRGPAPVELRRPGLAGDLDRPALLRRHSPNSLRVTGAERWAEPLGDLFTRILAEDLNNRLPGSNVFTSAGSITAEADTTVEIDIQRFDADPTGQVVLLTQVAVSHGRGRASAATRVLRFTVQPAGPGTPNLVAAMSAALGQLADALAAMLREPTADPAPASEGARKSKSSRRS